MARSIDSEMKRTGDDCMFLDIRSKGRKYLMTRFPNIYQKCMEFGIDMASDLIPIVPAAHYMCGGIQATTDGRTSIKGRRDMLQGAVACERRHERNNSQMKSSPGLALSVSVAALVAMRLAAVPVVTEIPLLEGERWWGGGGADGQSQPYGIADSRRIDLRGHGNTSSPLLVSSCGRYVWSEKPFGYEFRAGRLVLDSDVERIEPVVAGKTLKDAYLAAAKAHMRFEGRTPPDIFFSLPQWNNWIEIFLNGTNQKSVDAFTEELAHAFCNGDAFRLPACRAYDAYNE